MKMHAFRLAPVAVLLFAAAARPGEAPVGSTALAAERALHLARLGADRWHAAGARGRGLKVAVLDGGFRGYKSFLGGALPKTVTVRSFRKDGDFEGKNTQHGIMCAEVVHALAPEAELLLANWEEDEPESFLAAVKWAREQGARVLTCSIIMPRLSDGEGGGPIHAALARLVGRGVAADDRLFFACAGNTAERHWAGPFAPDRDGFHQWKPGVIDNPVSPWGGERASVDLCCKPGSRYEVLVYDDAGTLVARSPAGADGSTFARFVPDSARGYRLRLRLAGGTPGPFHVVSLQAWLGETTLAGSVSFPADGAEVVTVGACDPDGQRTSYSACGLAPRLVKPDLVAPVPFATATRSRPFAGTSAATPQAAALAALVWSRHPDWKAAQVREALRASAHDLGPKGFDVETGHGLSRLPAVDR